MIRSPLNHRQILRLVAAVLFWLLLGAPGSGQAPGQAPHPLDALTAGEIRTAVQSAQRHGLMNRETQVVYAMAALPDKQALLSQSPVPRRFRLLLYDYSPDRRLEVILSDRGELISQRRLEGMPRLLPQDRDRAIAAVSDDPRWAAALARRGLRPGDYQVTAGPPGPYLRPEDPDARLALVLAHRAAPAAGLVGGLSAIVDLTAGKLLRLHDTPLQETQISYRQVFGPYPPGVVAAAPQMAAAPQPAGNLRIRGNQIEWMNWRFHAAIHPRDGLLLSLVEYRDGDRRRPVLYRAGLAEIVVPYGDPFWPAIAPFDSGDAGLAIYGLSPLRVGVDVPAGAQLLPAVLHDPRGNPVTVPAAIGIYERHHGALWRHGADGRANQELVVCSYVKIDNYDYGVEWVFRLDGAIRVDLLMTGIMNYRPARAGEEMSEYAHMVEPGIVAPNHQHFFNFRLDFDIDGAGGNRVHEVETTAGPAVSGFPLTPMRMVERQLATERAACRTTAEQKSRRWRFGAAEPSSSGYFLIPDANPEPILSRESPLGRQGGFLEGALWVTRYDPAELHPAGEQTWGSRGKEGLPAWAADDASLDGADLVAWYTVGATHLPRPEEWPVMPVARAGFLLTPAGFFRSNPAAGMRVR